MIPGNEFMLSPTYEKERGHLGNGFVRITQLAPIILSQHSTLKSIKAISYILVTLNS